MLCEETKTERLWQAEGIGDLWFFKSSVFLFSRTSPPTFHRSPFTSCNAKKDSPRMHQKVFKSNSICIQSMLLGLVEVQCHCIHLRPSVDGWVKLKARCRKDNVFRIMWPSPHRPPMGGCHDSVASPIFPPEVGVAAPGYRTCSTPGEPEENPVCS